MPLPTQTPAQPIDVLAQAASAQFADRPTLYSVTAQLLADNLQEKYPPLTLTTSELRLALPREGGGRDLVPLMAVAMNYLADRTLPDLAPRSGLAGYLGNANGDRLTYPVNGQQREYDLTVVLAVISELPPILFIAFQEALATYWGQTGDAGMTRWQWLGDLLRTSLRTGALRHTGLLAEQRRMLDTVLDYPDLQTRSQLGSADNLIHAYTLETVLIQSGRRTTVQASDLLLVDAKNVLLCGAAGTIEAFASLDAFGQTWGQRFAQRYNTDQVMWNRFEPAGSIFDTQAALLLAQQLDDLAAMSTAAPMDRQTLERRYQTITDLSPRLSDTPPLPGTQQQPLTQAMPDWLKKANPSQRFYYFQHLSQLAAVKRRTEGRQFLDGLKDLRTYTADALFEQMQTHPNATGYRPEKLQLTFAVAVGDLGSGYIEPVKMSLTELAVKNLSGKPHGRMTVHHTDGLPVPGWMSQTYIEGLVTEVNIGGRYPQWLNEQLLADSPQAHQREALFDEQMHVQLPIQALTLWTRGEAGFTRQGYRYVAALVNLTQADRTVDGQEIVIRPLAFLRRPGAAPDTVADMYIIEPRDSSVGPHILYRGQYSENLREFPSRAALLDAITTPGELQDSVLTWLPDVTRAVYDHGGFHEPHLTRFINVGSEFDPLTAPAPAQLAVDETNGELLTALTNGQMMSYLFGSYARTLIRIAEQTSTSNAESRWAVVLEGSWLLFNTLLLPLLRGPAMLAGWMLQMAPSLIQDIPNLNNADPSIRETAWAELLVNLGLVLLHMGLPASAPRPPASRYEAVALEPWQRSTAPAAAKPVTITPGIVGLPQEPPALGRALIDFKASSARSAGTERLFQSMLDLRVPWPEPPPAPVALGPFRGLYLINGTWHANVKGRLFPVNIVPGFGEVFVAGKDPLVPPGIQLRSDGQGHWFIDEGLKLQGGGPKRRIAAKQQQTREQIAQLKVECDALRQQLGPLIDTQNSAITSLRSARSDFESQFRKLQIAWRLLSQADEPRRAEFMQRHAAEQRKTDAAHAAVQAQLATTTERINATLPLRQQLIGKLKTLSALENLAQYPGQRAAQLSNTLNLQNILREQIRLLLSDHSYSSQGEPLMDLMNRATQELGKGGQDLYLQFLARLESYQKVLGQLIECSSGIEQTLEQMATDSPVSAEARQQLLNAVERPEVFFSQNLKLSNLSALREISIDRRGGLRLPDAYFHMRTLIEPDLGLASAAHIEMRSSSGYSAAERKAVLETALVQYERFEHASRALEAIDPTCVRQPYQQQWVEALTQARALVENELESLARESDGFEVALPVSKPFRVRPAAKRVFKTRNRGTLVGDFSPTAADLPGAVIQVTDIVTNQPLSRFNEHPAEGVWVEISLAPPPEPKPVPERMSLNSLRDAGVALKLDRDTIVRTVQREFRLLDDPSRRDALLPVTWKDMLEQVADKFSKLADDFASHADAGNQVIDYRSEAQAARDQAKRFYLDGLMKQSPTAEKLDILWRAGAVDVRWVPQRTKPGAKELLKEYEIVDRLVPPKTLWYAHFHYNVGQQPEIGHLKTVAQRFTGLRDQIEEERRTGQVTRIWRSRIEGEQARRIFPGL